MARYKGANGQRVQIVKGACRRAEMVRMYLRGHTQTEIAEAMGTTQSRVSITLKEQVEAWRREAAEAIATSREEQLAKLNHLEAEAYAGFDRSCRKGRTGDPTWLDTVRRIIEMRCKILGLIGQTPGTTVNVFTIERLAEEVRRAREEQDSLPAPPDDRDHIELY